jgi:nucleotide-binding universal stress UspA family protein
VVRVVPRAVGFARVPAAWLRLRGEVARLLPRTQHVSTRLRIVRGDAAEQLTRLAARADVLVVGARMNSRHGAPLGGQTVPAILSGASCPVIICDDGAEPDTRTGGHAEDDTRLR